MKKQPEVESRQARLEGRVLARVFAEDLRQVAGGEVKQVATLHNYGDTEIKDDPTGALADHEA